MDTMIDRTSTALLEGLSDPANASVWREFDERYRPILLAFARRMGLNDVDAADMAQEAMLRFVKAYREGQYDRSRGRLRSWLTGMARNSLRDMRRRIERRGERRGLSALEALPGEEEMEAAWDAECERAVLRRGLDELRTTTRTDERTIQTFERLMLDDRAPADVAREMSITLNEVYVAKHRCLRRLRDIVRRLERAYEI